MSIVRLAPPTGTFKDDVIWAQITMLDAAHGDCNLIDLNGDPTGDFMAKGHNFRTLIDTGPSTNDGLDLIKKVLTTVAPPSAMPLTLDAVPKVNMVQITHIDDDHAGNVIPLVREISADPNTDLRSKFVRTNFCFHEFLDAYPRFNIIISDGKGTQLRARTDDTQWLETAKYAGYIPSYEYQYAHCISLATAYGTLKPNVGQQMGLPAPPQANSKWKLTERADSPVLKLDDVLRKLKSTKLAKAPNKPTTALKVTCTIRFQRYKKTVNSKVHHWEDVETDDWTTGSKKAVKKTFEIRITEVFQVEHEMLSGHWTPSRLSKPDLSKTSKIVVIPQEPVIPDWGDTSQTAVFIRLPEELVKLHKKYPRTVDPMSLMAPIQGEKIPTTYLGTPAPLWDVNINGPTKSLHKDLIATALSVAIKNINYKTSEVDWKLGKDDLANRASVITGFNKREPSSTSTEFSMLFTGDAHDRHCNIRDTIGAWANVTPLEKLKQLSVLKVPHHASDVTADTQFYETIGSRVYLVSAQQKAHGSPSLASLQAMIKRIRLPPGSPPPGPVHYFFFSDPNTLGPITWATGKNIGKKYKSNVAILLDNDSEFKPNTDPNAGDVYNYECYRLKQLKNGKSFGRILFGPKAGTGTGASLGGLADLQVYFDATPAGDWVKMVQKDIIPI